MGKQLYRLPNISINTITDVGQMKRAQPTALLSKQHGSSQCCFYSCHKQKGRLKKWLFVFYEP
jgi:hypothetical protein